jgi:Fe2+ or Zn2+ uptake regulation protein
MRLGKNQEIILDFLRKHKGQRFYLTQLVQELQKLGYNIDIYKIKSSVRRLAERGLIHREIQGCKTYVWVEG